MSFILDALKKSETDRQRQTGPALFEVKVAQPKAGFPVWAIAIVALLAINMVIVGWLLLRRTSRSDESAGQNTPPPAASQPAPTQGSNSGNWSPSASTVPPQANAQQAYSPPGGQQNQSQANMARGESDEQSSGRMGDRDQREPTLGGNAGAGGANNGNIGGASSTGRFGANGAGATGAAGEGAGAGSAGGAGGGPNGGGAFGANGTGGGPNGGGAFGANGAGGGPNGRGGTFGANGAGGGTGALGTGGRNGAGMTAANGEPGAEASSGNPDDYAPAQDPGSSLFKGHVKRGTESGYMLYQDLAVTNGANLPELRLDMHVYDPKPQNRFALINMHKMREGETIQDVRVEAITPEGVVMSHNGTKFLLPRE